MKKLIFIIIFCFACTFIQAQTAEEYYNSGIAKANLSDYTGAISDYSKAIELNPTYELPYYYRGFSKLNLSDCRGALSDFNKAIELNPKYAEAYAFRGLSKDKLSDHTGAISDFNKAIELDPKNVTAYFSRGLGKYFFLRDKEGACLDMSKAGELGSSLAYDFIKEHCN